ncbi:MAG: TonB-dependent receptor [Chitinophagales bacterium]
MKNLILALTILFTSLSAMAQNASLTGVVQSQADNTTLPSAHVSLTGTDVTFEQTVVTNLDGEFRFEGLERGAYTLKVSFLGFEELQKSLEITKKNNDIGKLFLAEEVTELEGVEVKEKLPIAVQKGDTTQFNANAFKVNPDANAEDLIEKMPTVVIQDGKVQAQGEDVKRVLVDGRPFFGEDPNAALKNLPAEIIDKIQIYDEQSDQSKFTGFDDGQSSKTINIITKGNSKNGQFGKVYLGYGLDNKYALGGNINLFNGDQRISIIGLSNNVNVQNFSTEDLLGVVGSSGSRGGRGGRGGGGSRGGSGSGGSRGGGGFGGGSSVSDFLVNPSGGISTTSAFGLNFSDKWGEKMEVSGSYFFNKSNTESIENLQREFLDVTDASEIYTENNNSESNNINHRFSAKLDYNIDSNNSITMRPRLTLQQNDGYSATFGQTALDNTLLNQTSNNFLSDLSAVDFSNSILFRHKFEKDRRTLSVNVNTGYTEKQGESTLESANQYFTESINDSLYQQSILDANGWKVGANISYTEPIGEKSMLMLNYSADWQQDKSDKKTYDFDPNSEGFDQFNENLSNTFESHAFIQQLGLGYNYRPNKDLMVMARANLQKTTLESDQLFPNERLLKQDFTTVVPFAMLRYNLSKQKNIRLGYRSNTDLPNLEQLQNVVDNSNPLQLSLGNPDLTQAYQHNIFSRYSATNTDKSTVFFATLNLTFSDNYIGRSTYLDQTDNPIFDNLTLADGVQLSQPVNLNGYSKIRSFITYGLPISPIKSNLNFNISADYTKQPGLVNDELNFANNSTFGLGAVLSSNISEKVDFTISSRSNFSNVNNSLRSDLNTSYFNQNTSFKLTLTPIEGLVLRTDLNHQSYTGLSDGFNQNFLLWNASIGKKLFKDNRGEISLAVFDILKQNNNISRNVTSTYIEDSETNALQQYALLTFTYQLKHFNIK